MKSKEDILNRLENVEEVHRQHKRTYSIPRLDERQSLRPGQLVKLVFLADEAEEGARAERMWVEVEGAAGGQYIGKLSNRPHYLTYVQKGDYVVFYPYHVSAIYVDRQAQNWIDPTKNAMVHAQIIEEENVWPDTAIRIEPASDADSGWIIGKAPNFKGTSGDIDKTIYREVTLHDLMNKYPILDSILGEPIGSRWAWDEESCEYRTLAEN